MFARNASAEPQADAGAATGPGRSPGTAAAARRKGCLPATLPPGHSPGETAGVHLSALVSQGTGLLFFRVSPVTPVGLIPVTSVLKRGHTW